MDLYQEIVNLKRDNDKAWQLVKKLEEENTTLQNGLRNCAKDYNIKLIKEIDNNKKNLVKRIREEIEKNKRLKKFIVKNCNITIDTINVLIKNSSNSDQYR